MIPAARTWLPGKLQLFRELNRDILVSTVASLGQGCEDCELPIAVISTRVDRHSDAREELQ